MTNLVTDYEIQDIAMNLIMNGYATAEDAVRKAKAIKAGMAVISNLNEAAAVEADKCETYQTAATLYSKGSVYNRPEITSTSKANELLNLKKVEWKMMMDVTGLNEFQIMEVA